MDPNTSLATPAPAPKNGKKILIIEDENFISDLYDRALRAGGYETAVVMDGEEALKDAKTNREGGM